MERQSKEALLGRSCLIAASAGILGLVGAVGHDLNSGQQAERIQYCLDEQPRISSIDTRVRDCLETPSRLFFPPPGQEIVLPDSTLTDITSLQQLRSELQQDSKGLDRDDILDTNTLMGISGGAALACIGMYLVNRISVRRRRL